jgi:hypothetical protein
MLRHLFPFRMPSSSLAIFVIHVVLIGAQKQVFRPDAWWIVARMKNVHTVRNRTYCKSPCRAMSRCFGPIAITHKNESVSLSCGFTLPDPTRFSFFDLRPKSFSQGEFNSRQIMSSSLEGSCRTTGFVRSAFSSFSRSASDKSLIGALSAPLVRPVM